MICTFVPCYELMLAVISLFTYIGFQSFSVLMVGFTQVTYDVSEDSGSTQACISIVGELSESTEFSTLIIISTDDSNALGEYNIGSAKTNRIIHIDIFED